MSTADRDAGRPVALIVTCRKSSGRRLASATEALNSLDAGLPVEVIDGFVAEDSVVDSLYDPVANRWRVKRPVSRAEVAVYASHRLAWQRLLDSGHSAALVLEDDFGLNEPDKVAGIIAMSSAILETGCDMVKLFDFDKKTGNRAAFSRRIGDIELVKWRAPTAGMVAYLISRRGAEKFLARARVFRQVDEDTKYYWELGLDIWSVPGNPVVEISPSLGGSVVEAARESMKTRNLRRSLWGNLLTADRKLRTRFHLMRERVGRQGRAKAAALRRAKS